MPATASPPRPKTPVRAKRILVAIALILLVTAAGLELGARIIGRARGKPWTSEAIRADLESEFQAVSRRSFVPGGLQDENRAREAPNTQVLQPYVGWEHMSTQELIVQGTEHYASPRGETAFDLCIMGGSVAQTFAEKGRERLAEILRRDAHIRGREILVHNYACAGYKQPQQLMFLAYLLALGHKPDMVIELDGFNDAALAWSNRTSGVNPAYPYSPFWSNVMRGLRPDWEWAEHMHATHESQDRAIAFGEWFLRSRLWKSSFLGQIGLVHFERLRYEYVECYKNMHAYIESRPKDAELKGPRFALGEKQIADCIVNIWEESSLGMQGLCTEHGIAYLHVLQPTLKDGGSKPLTDKEIAGSGAEPDWIEGVVRLYPLLKSGGSRLTAHGVAFFDATGIFREHPEDLYIDVCHLNQLGNDIMADAVAGAVIEALGRKR